MDETMSKDSQTVRAGSTTYFLDINETKTGKPYLAIIVNMVRRQRTALVFPPNPLNPPSGVLHRPNPMSARVKSPFLRKTI